MTEKIKKIEQSLKLLQLLELPAYGGVCIIMMLVFGLLSLVCQTGNLPSFSIIVVLGIVALCDLISTVLVESRAIVRLPFEREDQPNLRYASALILFAPLLMVVLAKGLLGDRAVWAFYLYAIYLSLAYVVHLTTALRLLYLLRKTAFVEKN